MSNANDLIIHAGDADFKKEVIESSIPVFVDFYATWCGPCKYFAGVMSEVAPEFNGKVKFVKVNIDENPQLASQMKIFSVPTLMFFKNGKREKSLTGALPKDAFTSELSDFIK